MNNYKYLYLFWLIPGFLLFLVLHQASVYFGVIDTYDNGTSYTAEVVEYDLKQIAAQTNGYVILRFKTETGEQIQKKLSLPVEMAGKLQEISIVPIRYQEDAFQSIVMMPTYDTQKGLALTNIGMAFVGLVITIGIGLAVNRFIRKQKTVGIEELIIERIDKDE